MKKKLTASRRTWTMALCFGLGLGAMAAPQTATTMAQDPESTTATQDTETVDPTIEVWEKLDDEAKQLAEEMKRTFPADSEAMAMLTAILEGRRMGPDDGWFAMAKPDGKYQWEDMLTRWDANENGIISQKEFSGDPADFAAMDRNKDQRWSKSDWEWAHSRGSDTFGILTRFADTDDSGQIDAAELKDFADRFASEDGKPISLETFRQLIEPPERDNGNRRGGPTPSHLVKGLYKQEIGSHQPGPKVGEVAPDFELDDLKGQPHSLKEALSSKPTVLIFGNYTCGPYRSQAGNVRDLIERYQDRVNFLMVYVREAHPADGWNMTRNQQRGIEIMQPTSYDQRKAIATQCAQHFDAGVPMLVDSLEDPVGAMYSGMPGRLYLIDQGQRVIYKSGRGPHYFWPSDLENALVAFLNDPEVTTP